ncbi:hypothetical protein JYQ62_19395 [Nostoc sp. UHCC 0702]|nr:hypothetical protein JYQ62_19395 [Nostoc sp. UHCC 0702]
MPVGEALEAKEEKNEGEQSSSISVAKLLKQLTPEELAWSISWASNDPENPLSDEHLEALIKSAQYVLNKRAASSIPLPK